MCIFFLRARTSPRCFDLPSWFTSTILGTHHLAGLTCISLPGRCLTSKRHTPLAAFVFREHCYGLRGLCFFLSCLCVCLFLYTPECVKSPCCISSRGLVASTTTTTTTPCVCVCVCVRVCQCAHTHQRSRPAQQDGPSAANDQVVNDDARPRVSIKPATRLTVGVPFHRSYLRDDGDEWQQ